MMKKGLVWLYVVGVIALYTAQAADADELSQMVLAVEERVSEFEEVNKQEVKTLDDSIGASKTEGTTGPAPQTDAAQDALERRVQRLERQIRDLKKAADNKTIFAGYEDGRFVLRSPDGDYTLIPRIRIQFQHRLQLIEDSADTNDFFLRRGRLGLEGHVMTKDLEYEVEFDFGTPDPGDPQFDLKDLYFDYRLAKPIRLKGGQYKVPFGFQELTTSKKLQFVERSLASEEFAPGRDIGMMVWGPNKGESIEYYAGVFNGDKDNQFNSNTELLYAGRVVLNPLGTYKKGESDLTGTASPRLTMGVEGFQTKDPTAGDDLVVVGASAGFKFAGLSLRAEYFHRLNLEDQSTNARDLDGQGYYAQAGYFLIPKRLEGALRVSQIFRDGGDNDEREYGAALNIFFKGHKAKLQLDYTFLLDDDAIQGPDDETRHILRTQFQLYF